MPHQEKPLIEEILPRLYRVQIPLPNSPLKATNSYFFKGTDRSLIIDTGLNEKVCLDAMNAAVKRLGIDLAATDFFITHAHIDHVGLVTALASKSMKVYFNKPESEQSGASIIRWAKTSSVYAYRHGYHNNRIRQMVANVNAPEKSTVYPEFSAYTILKENDTLTAGDYYFRVIETPGHSRGHMCLYEKRQKIFVSGDHILGDITPNISSRYNDTENPLGEYLASLDKVYPLEVKYTLPGHRRLITDFKARITELKNHHKERADEVMEILKQGDRNAYQVASMMTWDLNYDTWEEIPFYPKWFAFSEALSHLQYLESLGKVKQVISADGQVSFTIN